MMPWTIPIRHARWLMYTGDMIDGREAERIHLVNKAVPAEDLMNEAKRLARKLARMPVPAIQTAKAALNNQQEGAGFAQSWDLQSRCRRQTPCRRERQALDGTAQRPVPEGVSPQSGKHRSRILTDRRAFEGQPDRIAMSRFDP